MKTIIRELRLILALMLLDLVFSIAPHNHTDGRKLKAKINEYIEDIINNK